MVEVEFEFENVELSLTLLKDTWNGVKLWPQLKTVAVLRSRLTQAFSRTCFNAAFEEAPQSQFRRRSTKCKYGFASEINRAGGSDTSVCYQSHGDKVMSVDVLDEFCFREKTPLGLTGTVKVEAWIVRIVLKHARRVLTARGFGR